MQLGGLRLLNEQWLACAVPPLDETGAAADGAAAALPDGAPCTDDFYANAARYVDQTHGMLTLTVGGQSLSARFILRVRPSCHQPSARTRCCVLTGVAHARRRAARHTPCARRRCCA